MKTLDEVIKRIDPIVKHDTMWLDEHHCIIGESTIADALYYLKKLKRVQGRIENIAVGNIEDTLAKLDNPPITWEELKQMEGKPVWVEYEGYEYDWEIIEIVGATKWATGEFVETNKSLLHKEDIGKTWNAYRKERE